MQYKTLNRSDGERSCPMFSPLCPWVLVLTPLTSSPLHLQSLLIMHNLLSQCPRPYPCSPLLALCSVTHFPPPPCVSSKPPMYGHDNPRSTPASGIYFEICCLFIYFPSSTPSEACVAGDVKGGDYRRLFPLAAHSQQTKSND